MCSGGSAVRRSARQAARGASSAGHAAPRAASSSSTRHITRRCGGSTWRQCTSHTRAPERRHGADCRPPPPAAGSIAARPPLDDAREASNKLHCTTARMNEWMNGQPPRDHVLLHLFENHPRPALINTLARTAHARSSGSSCFLC